MSNSVHTRLYKIIDGERNLAYPETCGEQVVMNDGRTVETVLSDMQEKIGTVRDPVILTVQGTAYTSGDTITVPEYIVGSGKLEVYICGILCSGGTDPETCAYEEVGTTGSASVSIRWLQDIQSEYILKFVVR